MKFGVLWGVKFQARYGNMRLENAPLVHVLAQVVFSPVPKLSEAIPDFQASMLDLDFPWVQQGTVQEITVIGEAPPKVESRPRWDFLSPDRSTGVLLTGNTLVLQTTRYTEAGPFRAQLEAVLLALYRAAAPRLVERLGLRYTDLVRLNANESFDQFVVPGMLGFPVALVPNLQSSLVGLVTQVIASTQVGVLAVRSSLVPPGQPVPSDLLPSPLQFPQEALSSSPALVLDFDHFAQFSRPFEFEPASIGDYMRQLRDASHAAFLAVCTPFAIERWGPWTGEGVNA